MTSGRDNAPGILADTSLQNRKFESSFLAFLHLVGVVYTKKHESAFTKSTVGTDFSYFYKDGLSPLYQHTGWLQDIKQAMWDTVPFENEMIPSTDTLHRHCKPAY